MRRCERCKANGRDIHHLEVGRFFADQGGEYCEAGNSCAACAAELDTLIQEAVARWKGNAAGQGVGSCVGSEAGR